MTVQEAIEIIKYAYAFNSENSPLTKALDVAIEGLEKLEALEKNKTYQLYRQYLSIGTVEELKEAREKQVAKKPIEKEFHKMLHWNCPICEGGLFHEQQYCDECGTKIYWGEEDEPMSNSSPRL